MNVGLVSRVQLPENSRILVRVASYTGYFSWKNQATIVFFSYTDFPHRLTEWGEEENVLMFIW
jgi:hypothetical protein